MNIEVKLTGKCKGCPSVSIISNHLFEGDRIVKTVHRCLHLDLCEHLERHLQEFHAREAENDG